MKSLSRVLATLSGPVDCSLPGSSIHGIFQARVLEWGARTLFKKIGDIKWTFYSKIGTVKDKNSKDLTEAEEIKKRWQEYTELYWKSLNDLDNHNGVITHLEPDIL